MKTDSGNQFSIILLILPIISLILMITQKVIFPINQKDFLVHSFEYGVVTFLIISAFSFYQAYFSKTLIAVISFLFIFWMIVSVYLTGYINYKFDDNKSIRTRTKILQHKYISGGIRSRSYCLLFISPTIQQSETITMRSDYCDIIHESDEIEFDLHPGFLNLGWKNNEMIFRKAPKK